MQLDLALFLRLTRTLEGGRSAAVALNPEAEAVAHAVDALLAGLNERAEYLRGRQAVQSVPAAEEVDALLEETGEVTPPPAPPEPPPIPAAAVKPEKAPEAPPPIAREEVVWGKRHDLLYEDVLWLFKVGDNEGALISLGRLLNTAAGTPELARFVDINQDKLVSLYEKILGDFDRAFIVSGDGLGSRYFWDAAEAQTIFHCVKEYGTIARVLANSPAPKLKTLSLLHRFHVERVLSFGDEAEVGTKH